MSREPLAAPDVVQLKALEADKLNIAGELHPESKARRKEEAQYASAKNVNGYWTEGEFTYTKYTKFFGRNVPLTGKEQHGDPFGLRVEHLLSQLGTKYAGWLQDFATGKLPSGLGLPPSTTLDVAWGSFSGALQGALREPMTGLEHMIDSPAEKETAANATSTYALLEGAINKLHAVPADDHAIKALAKDVNADIAAARKAFTETLHGKGQPNRSEDVISASRSDAMLEGARNSGKHGLWKVGNSHITDMLNASPEQRAGLNIMTRDEFNADYQTWESTAKPKAP